MLVFMAKYYVDTCIWIDLVDDRIRGRRLYGEYAQKFFRQVIDAEQTIVYSDVVEEELSFHYGAHKSQQIINSVPLLLLERVESTREELLMASRFSKEFGLSLNDAIHAVITYHHANMIITRDKHFSDLDKFITVKKPEELL